jgi:hypothetical protein
MQRVKSRFVFVLELQRYTMLCQSNYFLIECVMENTWLTTDAVLAAPQL